jgi:membrane protein DedA with SNARE-associated domain
MLIASLLAFGLSQTEAIEGYLQHAFYSGLFLILVLASLGLPIPEDVPLIVAGLLMHTHPGIADWRATFAVALVGIMSGDLILYFLGRRWGPDVVNHRSVRRLITPQILRRASDKFHRYGMWYCFFGRFLMGVRAAMCLTAGATRFPYSRFFLADFAGALLSIPLFMYLGYWFAGMLPTLRAYMTGAQIAISVAVAVGAVAALYYRVRRHRRCHDLKATAEDATGTPDPVDRTSAASGSGSQSSARLLPDHPVHAKPDS